MRRREFIAGALGSVAMWPVRSHAQKPTFVIGFLSAAWPDEELAKAVRQGLSDSGLVAGRNLTIEYRYANGKYDLLPSLAAELKSLPVSLIIAMPAPAAAAAKAATSTIPIVFLTGANPIENGLVPSYNKPGGNVTGIAMPANEITAKRIELLHTLLPDAVPIAELVNPKNPNIAGELRTSEQAARGLGREFFNVQASTRSEIESAFETVHQKKAALVVWHEGFFTAERALIVSLAERYAVIAIYGARLYTDIGGLISYGPDMFDACRMVGAYAGKVLNGTKPADLPVMQPTKFELVINLKTAKAMGLTMPPILLTGADAVIE